jgi:hypothetical protein
MNRTPIVRISGGIYVVMPILGGEAACLGIRALRPLTSARRIRCGIIRAPTSKRSSLASLREVHLSQLNKFSADGEPLIRPDSQVAQAA